MIRVKKKNGCVSGSTSGKLLLTPSHLAKYHKSKVGSILNLPFQHKHLVDNMKHKGGFLPLLAAALGPIIAGVAGGLIEKGIAGSGLFNRQQSLHDSISHDLFKSLHHKKKRSKKNIVKKKKGTGMYLNPWMGGK